MFLLKREHFNKRIIISGLYTAILFSAFIYFAHYGIQNKIVNSIAGLASIYLILTIEKKSLFYAGFFIGIFWCWWISLSFIHYDLSYLIPFIIIGIGIIYGVIFLCFGIFHDVIYTRALLLFGFSFVAPFGFNWIKPELLFVNSFFGITKLDFALIIISMVLLKKFKYIFFAPLLICLYLKPSFEPIKNDLKISMPQLMVKQEDKWKRENKLPLINKNFKLINKAIEDKSDLIILPETAMPVVLNQKEILMQILKDKSISIDIIIGSLYKKDGLYYNSTYHFSKGSVNIAHKVVLVPFGEAVPLPQKIRDFINDSFYNGAKDYEKAKEPTDFEIKGIKFRNAICYEATTDEIFKDINGVKFMIATSNNAWFSPSMQPTLQKILMKYYAKKYDVTIYSSANGSNNEIINP